MGCRDGGIEASIDHEGAWLASKELADVYSTEEPQAAFHARVAFCLDVHNEVRFGHAAVGRLMPPLPSCALIIRWFIL